MKLSGLAHLDEHGQPCTHHPAASPADLLALALVGSRAPSFHHDLASKLQGLMMAVDEIAEVTGEVPPPVIRAIDTARDALREILALLGGNRALTKAPVPAPTPLGELLARAAERVIVTFRCAAPAVTVEVPPPAMIHALSLVIDVAGGAGRGRTVEATAVHDGAVASISIGAATEVTQGAAEALALAAFALEASGGSLSCAAQGSRLVVRLPAVAEER